MSRVRVKICGVTRVEDALLAASLGADAVGLNFWPRSRRFVEPDAARAIVDALPPFVAAVGVFVNQRPTDVLATAARTGIAAVQLHGDEGWEDVNGYPLPALKAIRLAGPASVADLHRYRVRAFVLDAPSEGFGGSGARCDWALAREVAARVPVVLAGGLTPDDVEEAIRAVRPYAVDVASGVESAPGVKDPDKLARFLERARRA